MRKRLLASVLLYLVVLSGCNSYDSTFATASQTEPAESTVLPTETYAPIPESTFLDSFTDPDLNRIMEYHMYIPKDATEQMPLIVYLHGLGAVGNSALNSENPLIVKAREVYGDSFPFLILAPSSMGKETWISQDMPERVKNLVYYIADQYNVDRDKIIITGHSMGAAGVMRQVELYSDLYSAAIPISMPGTSFVKVEKCLDVPIWGLAGSDEFPSFVHMQTLMDEIKNAGGNAKFTLLEGVTHGKTALESYVYDVLYWAISQ
jgi:predicted peptidase